MRSVAELLTLLLLVATYSLVLRKAIFLFATKKITTAIALLPVIFIFYILPVLLDLVIGIPIYYKFRGFHEASVSVTVAVIYNIYLSIFLIAILRYFRIYERRIYNGDKRIYLAQKFKETVSKYEFIFVIFLISPLFAVFLSPDPSFYFTYKAITEADLTARPDTHFIVARSCQLAILSASILLFIEKRKFSKEIRLFRNIFVLLFVIASFWFFGKRSIVAYFAVSSLAIGVVSGQLTGKKFKRVAIIISILFGVFILMYGKNIDSNWVVTYENMRIDFARDAVLKFTIYRENVIESPILEYDFQTFLFNLLFYIPREIWPGKPYPYAVYLTSAVLGTSNVTYLGWGLTTSALSESIANSRWLGYFMGPLFILGLCYLSDKSNRMITKAFGMLIVSLFMVIHFSAFTVVFLVFIFLIIKERVKIIF